MARLPLAIWKGPIPSSNYAAGPTTKIGTVHHVIVGGADGALATFKNGANQVSAHFIVCGPGDSSPDGTIWQLLDTGDCCYAQANGNYPPTAYIGIETSGQPTTAMTAAQCEAMAQIDAWASTTHHFPLVGPVAHGTPGVAAHCNPNGTPDPAWGNHSCPGPARLAQIPPIVARARAITGTVPSPSTKDAAHMISATSTGLGYYIAHSDGAVFAYGDAKYLGGCNPGASAPFPAGVTAISIEAHPGGGYYVLSSTHQVYAFGCPYYGAPAS